MAGMIPNRAAEDMAAREAELRERVELPLALLEHARREEARLGRRRGNAGRRRFIVPLLAATVVIVVAVVAAVVVVLAHS